MNRWGELGVQDSCAQGWLLHDYNVPCQLLQAVVPQVICH